jgi:hypothetical protein
MFSVTPSVVAQLPQVHTKNGHNWHYKRPLLSNPLIKPTPAHIRLAAAITRQLLRIR